MQLVSGSFHYWKTVCVIVYTICNYQNESTSSYFWSLENPGPDELIQLQCTNILSNLASQFCPQYLSRAAKVGKNAHYKSRTKIVRLRFDWSRGCSCNSDTELPVSTLDVLLWELRPQREVEVALPSVVCVLKIEAGYIFCSGWRRAYPFVSRSIFRFVGIARLR